MGNARSKGRLEVNTGACAEAYTGACAEAYTGACAEAYTGAYAEEEVVLLEVKPAKKRKRVPDEHPTVCSPPLLRKRRCALKKKSYKEADEEDTSDDEEAYEPEEDYALPCTLDEFPEWILEHSPGNTLNLNDVQTVMGMPLRKLRQIYYLLDTDARGKRDGDVLEKLAARVFRRLGYHVQNTGAHVSQTCGDGGRDLVMHKHGLHYVVSCKNHKSRIGVAEVNRIVGVALHDKADVAIGLAAGWSKQALKHVKEMRDNQHVKVVLYDFKWLVKELARL